jgi:hypothetical protein
MNLHRKASKIAGRTGSQGNLSLQVKKSLNYNNFISFGSRSLFV